MRKAVACAAAFVLLLPLLAAAQQQAVEITSSAEVEVPQKNAAGKTEVKRIKATHANIAPGTVVLFTTTYRNRGKQPATGVVITNPVPEHMTYMDRSAEGTGTRIAFSIDGGKNYGEPAALTIKEADGGTRQALPAEYTHIQWTITAPLAPGASGSVTFRAAVK